MKNVASYIKPNLEVSDEGFQTVCLPKVWALSFLANLSGNGGDHFSLWTPLLLACGLDHLGPCPFVHYWAFLGFHSPSQISLLPALHSRWHHQYGTGGPLSPGYWLRQVAGFLYTGSQWCRSLYFHLWPLQLVYSTVKSELIPGAGDPSLQHFCLFLNQF